MADYVVNAVLVDQISTPANAASAALDKAATSADGLTASVTKAGPSAQNLVNSLDLSTKTANAYQTALSNLARNQATLTAGVAAGSITQEQMNAAMVTSQVKVAAARDAMAAATPVIGAMTGATVEAAAAAGSAAIAHGGFTTEIVRLGNEVVNGNYARIPSSMTVLAERSGQLNNILSTLGSLVFGWPGLFAAGAAALYYVGSAAESQAAQLGKLQSALQATRDDYVAMAAEATAAGKATAGYGGFSKTDTTAAAGTIASQPSFQGDQAQLAALVKTSADLATVWGETLPQASKTLASAMSDPGAEADALAKDHFPGMTTALADTIKAMQNGGDAAGAFGLLLDDIQGHVSGAATVTKTVLQTAMENLDAAFNQTGSDGKTMGQSIGGAVDDAAAHVVDAVASIVGQIDKLRNYNPASPSVPTLATAPVGENGYPASTANVLTSSTGALGVMQLEPATAAALGVDPNNAMDNIAGGMKLIAQLSQQYGANVDQILAAYNTGSPDTSTPAAQAYIAQVRAANPAALNNQTVMNGGQPESVAFAIQDAGNNVGLPQELITLGQQIAMVESGGRQYASAAYAPGSASIYPNEAAVGPFMTQAPSTAAGTPGSGVTNIPDAIINQATTIADKSGIPSISAATDLQNIDALKAGMAALADQGQTNTVAYTDMSAALDKYNLALYNAVGPAAAEVRTLADQAAGNDAVAAAWKNGAGAADIATAEVKAQQQAMQYAGTTGSQYGSILEALTAKQVALAQSQQEVTAGSTLNTQNQDLDYLQAEAATLGQSAEARATSLAVMKEQQTIENTMPLIDEAEKQKILDNVAAQSEMTYTLQQQQQALSELSSSFGSAFDTIGNAMAQAFVQGQGAAVNWKNVTASAIEQVVQELLKLAVLNPVLNSLFGQSNTTLGSVVSALAASSGGSSASSGSSASGILSDISSLGKLFGGNGGSISSTIDGLGSEYLPSLFAANSTDAALAGLGAGVYGPATAASVGSSSAGILAGLGGASSVLGGIGAVIPGLISGNYAQAAAGGIGAAIGTAIFPGIGTVLGGLAGNLLGGMIGPGPENPFSVTGVGTTNGQFNIGATQSQLVNPASYIATLQQQESDTNAFLAANNLATVSQSNMVRIGQTNDNNPGVYQDLYTPNSTGATAFSQFHFGSTADSTLNNWLNPQTFANLTDLENAVSGFETFVNTTVPGLVNFNTVTGSLQTTITGINATYAAAITQAQAYGVATTDLSNAQTAAVAAATAAADLTFNQGDQTNNANYLSAEATVTGNPADALAAQLAAFDLSATQQEAQLKTSLDDTYGTAYESTTAYAEHTAALETSLGEQRLAIQQQYNDALIQTANSTISSLGSYAQSLEFGSGSPLSATQQYSLAQGDFQSDVTGAQNGDYASLTDLQSAATTFLSASSAVNGSGAAYVADFNSVLDALQTVANLPTDTLTASVLQSETRTQTQQLQDSMAAIVAAVNAVQTTIAQANLQPARIT